MIYLALFLGGIWAFQNNPPFHRGVVNLATTAQQLVAQVSGTARSTTPNHGAASSTATVNEGDQPSGHWPSRQATVYINTTEPTLRAATEDAIKQWNRTGAFTFKLVNSPNRANVTVAAINDPASRAAGLAKMSVDQNTNTFVSGQVELNRAYLLDPEYGYNHQRIVNTVEHELGHVIGLGHTNQVSVMQPAGSYYTIQPRDVQDVNQIYRQAAKDKPARQQSDSQPE